MRSLAPRGVRQVACVGSMASPCYAGVGWLKTTGNASTGGWLHGKAGDRYHQTWASYLVKALSFFKNNGIEFWGVRMCHMCCSPSHTTQLTTQNEPIDGLDPKFPFNALGFTPETQVSQAGELTLRLMRSARLCEAGPRPSPARELPGRQADDDGRPAHTHGQLCQCGPLRPRGCAGACVCVSLCCELSTVQYISGIAVHWYEDMLESAEVSLGVTHNAFPEKFILSTEGLDRMACGLHVTCASMYWFPSFLPPGSVDWQLGPWCRVCLRHHREPSGVISCFLHAHSHAFRTGRWAGPTGVLSELYVRCI